MNRLEGAGQVVAHRLEAEDVELVWRSQRNHVLRHLPVHSFLAELHLFGDHSLVQFVGLQISFDAIHLVTEASPIRRHNVILKAVTYLPNPFELFAPVRPDLVELLQRADEAVYSLNGIVVARGNRREFRRKFGEFGHHQRRGEQRPEQSSVRHACYEQHRK